MEIQVSAIRQEKETRQPDSEGEMKLFLFTDDKIIYVDNRVESTKNLLEFKVSFVKFPCVSNKQLETETKFYNSLKIMKHV